MSSFLPFSGNDANKPAPSTGDAAPVWGQAAAGPRGLRTAVGGAIVPHLTFELGVGETVFFEHHIFLWKTTGLEIRLRGLAGAFKRLISGMDILVTEAVGPGTIAFSRDLPGEIRAFELAPGQELQVREHAFLAATSGIDYTWERSGGLATMMFGGTGLVIDRFVAGPSGGTVWLHGGGNVLEMNLAAGQQIDVEPGGWLYKDPSVTMETKFQGLRQGLLAGSDLACNRLTGPGRIGIQSMYAPLGHGASDQPDTPAQSAQNVVEAGAVGVAGALISSFFGKR
ncbi:MAG: AIM24 family protein [Pseudomonadota bacterium]